MKRLTLLFIILNSTGVFSQCVYCTTIEDAERDTSLVKSLDLSATGLNELPHELNKFKNLEYLNLSDNQINEIDFSQLSLPRLKEFDLSNNPGFNGAYMNNLIESMPVLELLNISGCAMPYISPEVGKLCNLKELNISDNNISYLPQEIELMTSLEILDLSDNNLQNNVFMFSQMWNIHDLKLTGNNNLNQEQLTQSLLFKNNLYSISLSTPSIKKVLPKGFATLNIEELEIGDSKIESLNGSVCRNENLKKVIFNNCEFTNPQAVFEWINSCKNLQEIEFKNMTIPYGITEIKNVETVRFDNCDFKNVSELSRIKPQIKVIADNCNIGSDGFMGNSKIATSYFSSLTPMYDLRNRTETIIPYQVKEFQMKSSEPKTITLSSSSFDIPQNAFLTSSGEEFRGEVTLRITELNDPVMNLLNGVPMAFNDGTDRVFASSGMFDFRAFDSQGNELKPNPENIIEVEIKDLQPSESPNLYVFNENTNNWVEIGKPQQTNYDEMRKKIMDSLNCIPDEKLVPFRQVPIMTYMEYKTFTKEPSQFVFQCEGSGRMRSKDENIRYLNNPDIKYLEKRVWKIDTTLSPYLDSLFCASKKDQKSTRKYMKGKGRYNYTNTPRIITNLKIEPNMDYDNFVMQFNYKDESIRIPVYEVLNGSIQSIQEKEKRNYKNYLKKRKESDKEVYKVELSSQEYIKKTADKVRQQQVDFIMADTLSRVDNIERLRLGLTSFGLINCDFYSRNTPLEILMLDTTAIDQYGESVYVPPLIRNVILNDNSILNSTDRSMPVFSKIKTISVFTIGTFEIAVIKGWVRLKNGIVRPNIERFSTENLSADEIRNRIINI